MLKLTVEVLLVLLVLSPLLSPRGDLICEGLVWVFRTVAAPGIIVGRGAIQSAHAFRPMVRAALRAQDYPVPDGSPPQGLWIWDQVGAVIGVACLVVFAALDWQVLSVTIESIMHLAGGPLPEVGKLIGLALVVAAAYTVFELANIAGITPIQRPWIFCSPRWRRVIAWLAILCLVATIVAGVAVAVYRQLQIQANHTATVLTINDPTHLYLPSPPEPLSSILLFTFIVLMWGVLGLVSAGSGLHILPLLGGLVVLAKLLGLGVVYLLFAACFLLVFITSCLCVATVLTFQVVMSLWVMCWNWSCSFPAAQRWHFTPIAPFSHPPFLADELVQELFPSQLRPYTSVGSADISEKEIAAMARTLHRFVTILGGGRSAITGLRSLRSAADRLGATAQILGMGHIATPTPAGQLRTSFAGDGVTDLTPTGQEGHNTIDRDPDSLVHAQGHALADNAIQAQFAAALSFGQTIWFGAFDALMQLVEELLEEIVARQPGQTILAVGLIPTPDRYTQRLQAGLESYVALHAAGIISATLCTDERSFLARTISPEAQQDYVSTLLASMIRAPQDWEQSPSITDVARAMGREAETGLVGVAMASECVAPGNQVGIYSAIRRLARRLPARGKGDLDDIIRQGIKAAQRAITDPACRAIDEIIDTDRPFYVVYTSPLHSTDPRWVHFIRATSKWLATNYANAVPIYASGHGTPDPRVTGSYWIQASVLFALPAMPAPLQAILDRKGLVTPVHSGAGTNGTATDVGPDLVTSAPVVS
jgi:hypothetical protein